MKFSVRPFAATLWFHFFLLQVLNINIRINFISFLVIFSAPKCQMSLKESRPFTVWIPIRLQTSCQKIKPLIPTLQPKMSPLQNQPKHKMNTKHMNLYHQMTLLNWIHIHLQSFSSQQEPHMIKINEMCNSTMRLLLSAPCWAVSSPGSRSSAFLPICSTSTRLKAAEGGCTLSPLCSCPWWSFSLILCIGTIRVKVEMFCRFEIVKLCGVVKSGFVSR